MESLQGPFNNPYFLGEHLNLESFEEGKALGFSNVPFLNTESLKHGEAFFNPIIFQDKMPFHQMLEEVDSPSLSVSPLTDPNFHLLLTLQQQKKPWKQPPLELESCITHVSELQSPVKSENKDQQFPHSSSCLEAASSVCNQENSSPNNCKGEDGNSDSPFGSVAAAQFSKQPPMQEKRKRKKRPRPSKNREEIESQRMTHIAVERNRRKQMNDHLNALRSLMPTSFIQRGDQASIVGGAIDFIKELEQLLQSLQARKLRHQTEEEGFSLDSSSSSAFNSFFTSPQYTTYSSSFQTEFEYPFDGFMAESKLAVADIEVTVIQTHVNLKILSRRRPGQLLKAIVALEKLCLVILHLNVTSSERAVLYSFNLKIEEECKLGSADEIATAVYQIFSFIDGH